MKSQSQNNLTVIAVIFMIVMLGLYLFITKGNSGLHENLRMNRVARVLERDEMVIHTYGTNCSIRRMESALQTAASSHGMYAHKSKYEVITSSGATKHIEVSWNSIKRGLWVEVHSFKELP